jgi:hypothetical protein
LPHCTICGVSFGTPEQVRAHIQGSGGEHAGIGFADAEQYISDAPIDEDGDADPPGGPPAGAAEEASKGTAGLDVPQRHVEGGAREQKDDPECPNCGSNRYFDASEHTDHPFGCPECSDGNNWFVYGEGSA